jgi:glutathione S-transferase
MRLYVKNPAPSVLKVQIFADECGKVLEEVEVPDTRSREFRKINPFGTVPVLQTVSGEMVAESLIICRYLDRLWNCGLFGDNEASALRVDLWERRADLLLYIPAVEYVHQTHPMFADRTEQHAEWAKVLAERAQAALGAFDRQLGKHEFLAGDRFSMADITDFLGISAFRAFRAIDLSECEAIRRWADGVGARPSMSRLASLSV